jgi:hypothetical protein
MHFRLILIGAASLAISFLASLFVMNWLWPRDGAGMKPELASMPPLPPATRSSTIVAPISIALTAIREAVDRAAPRTFNGNADNPAPQLIQNAVINWIVARGPIATSGGNNSLSIATPLNGSVHALGALTQTAGNAVNGLVSNLLGDAGKKLSNAGLGINIKNLDANADIHGTVAVTAHPTLLANWRVEPNLAGQVNLADTNVSAAGLKVNVNGQLRPIIDKMVAEQVATMQQRVRNNPIIEQTARAQWAKICRSIPLQAPGAGLPELWVEVRPVKVLAMQPKIDAANVQLTLAIDGETRITSAQTKPNCPFPSALEIVPSLDAGKVNIGVPIDLPFTEVNKIIDAQLKGKTFPDDGSGAVAITVKNATVEPAGDRLLISLLVSAEEKKTFFGFGGDATVHVYGKPVLDQTLQVLRLTDIQLAVESEAAFGLLGAAAKAAMPYLQKALADRAQIDLKPFAANARDKIAAVMKEFRKSDDGVTVDAAVTGLRLVDIAFDAKTLRVIAEADGTVNVAITSLPAL